VSLAKVQYTVCDTGVEFPDDAYSLGILSVPMNPDQWDVEILARQAAEGYWSDHDGWESEWPLDFEIYIDGKSYGVCAIEMESRPTFSANLNAVQHEPHP